MKARTKTGLLILVAWLIGGGIGFYLGFGKGAQVVGTLAAQIKVVEALSNVRRSVPALRADDPELMRRKVGIDLRLSLFYLNTYSAAVPFWKCSDGDRQALISAADYMAAHADPLIFNSAPELSRGLKFCSGSHLQ